VTKRPQTPQTPRTPKTPKIPSELFALRGTLGARPRLILGLVAPVTVLGLWVLLSARLFEDPAAEASARVAVQRALETGRKPGEIIDTQAGSVRIGPKGEALDPETGGAIRPRRAIVAKDFLPSPVDVLRGTLQLFFEKQLATAIYISTKRIVFAFLLAAACALPLGILMASFEPVNRFFEPIVAPLRYMPISAFIPLLIAWFGIWEAQKIAFLFLGVFVYLLPVVVSALRAVPQEYIDTAYTLGASKGKVITTVLVPAALPDIFDSFRVMNAISWTYVILAEVVNPLDQLGRPSLGYLTNLGYTHSKPAWSFAGLLVIGAIGLITDALIRGMNRVLFRWRESNG
jgi:NitT/TauT family transport system permease protein